MLGRIFPSVALLLLAAACGDLKEAPPADASTSGSSSGSWGGASTSGSSGAPGTVGSGRFLLPSGYCCTSNDDCRNGRCEDVGGGKACRDECRFSRNCARPDLAWVCDNGDEAVVPGWCKPSGAFTCIAPSTFEAGPRTDGECCSATGDGAAGLECTGSLCIAHQDGPFLCSRGCAQPGDCPSGFVCRQVTDTVKRCVPGNDSYTCK